MTLVSLITPSLNQAAFLDEAMRSALEQDYGEIEYLVVDGGSADGSLDIIHKYSDRLSWWVSEQDRGQADAINKAFAHSHGEILAWLNSDDAYLPGAVRAAVSALETHPEATMVYGNTIAVDDRGQKINRLRYRQLSLQDLLCFQIIGQPAVFMRRAAFEAVGGLDTRLHFLLDHQLWIKLATRGPILHVDETWAAARFHAGAKNRAQAVEFGGEAFLVLEWAEKDAATAVPLAHVKRKAWAAANRVNARYLLDGGQAGPALGAWMKALLIHPPTALRRLNLAGSAVLQLAGLGTVREAVLRQRQKHLSA